MDLYFAPMSCAMATRAALYEAGVPATFRRVDLRTGRLEDGTDFRSINPMGQVPTLRTDDGDLLTENVAVLPFIADLKPEAGLAPQDRAGRYRLQQWLGFIASELHKVVFYPLVHPLGNDGAKAFAREMMGARFAFLERELAGREHLLDRFTVADIYLATVLGWTRGFAIDLSPWPAVYAYLARIGRRPQFARAYREELAMFREAREASR
jgi:glutathione S-transferase